MAARRWKLPGIQDLSKDQEAALACPPRGQFLIIGGPGTGKSVIATLRAMQFQLRNTDHIFLVYNHMLLEACKQLTGNELTSNTYLRWYRKQFEVTTGDKGLPRKKPSTPYPINWQAVSDRVANADRGGTGNSECECECLVIDEGQDMPPEFYSTLIQMGYEDFFVAADQNQQITKDNSSRQDLEDCLAIDTEDVIELRYNYRNNYGVALLAQAFYTGDPASPRPMLPKRSQRLHTPKLYIFEPGPDAYVRIAQAICKYYRRDEERLIGILTPTNGVRERYLQALKGVLDRPDQDPVPISTYSSGNNINVRFDQGGIMVINAQSCKGLEFDTVVLADIDEHYFFPGNPEATMKLFYVMVSRARDRVFLMMKCKSKSPILELLPDDQSVLLHKNILQRKA